MESETYFLVEREPAMSGIDTICRRRKLKCCNLAPALICTLATTLLCRQLVSVISWGTTCIAAEVVGQNNFGRQDTVAHRPWIIWRKVIRRKVPDVPLQLPDCGGSAAKPRLTTSVSARREVNTAVILECSDGGALLAVPVAPEKTSESEAHRFPWGDLVIIKLDRTGRISWSHRFKPPSLRKISGGAFFYATRLLESRPQDSGSAFIVATTDWPGLNDIGGSPSCAGDLLVAKFSASGDLDWSVLEGRSGAGVPLWLTTLEDGSTVVAAVAWWRTKEEPEETGIGYERRFIALLINKSGEVVWLKEFGSWSEIAAFCAARPWGKQFWEPLSGSKPMNAINEKFASDGRVPWYVFPRAGLVKPLRDGRTVILSWRYDQDLRRGSLHCYMVNKEGQELWDKEVYHQDKIEEPVVCSRVEASVPTEGTIAILVLSCPEVEDKSKLRLIGLNESGHVEWELDMGAAIGADIDTGGTGQVFVSQSLEDRLIIWKIGIP